MPGRSSTSGLTVDVCLCVPDDQEVHLPKRRRAPRRMPNGAPIPRMGEVVYLSSTSAWKVLMVIHEWRALDQLRVEVWLEYVGGARDRRPPGFELTQ